MMLLIKTIMSVLKISTNVITLITAGPIRLAAILVIITGLDLQNYRYSIII